MSFYAIFYTGGGGGGNADSQAPLIPAGQTITVSATAPNSTVVGHIASSDNVSVVSMDITNGNIGGAFYLAPNGDLWVNSQAAVAAQTGFTLTVTATDAAGNVGTGTVAVVVTPSWTYAWENRPPYVEPDPTAAAGTAGKTLATSLGITQRINIATIAQWNSAASTATPGTQLYVTANLVGDGTSTTLNWIGSNTSNGAGSAPSGTETNPIMVTCAPNVWIDGGLTAGSENLSSRCLQVRGTKHFWCYGANFRNANFGVKYDTCNSTAAAPARFWYCKVTNSGHSLVQFAGYFGLGVGGVYGGSSYIDARYNELWSSGLANNEFGEAFYIGQGSATAYNHSVNHHITIAANYIHHIPAEALDAKSGSYSIKFNQNLVADCGDTLTRTGEAADVGFPGSVQMFPPGLYGDHGVIIDSEVIGNRFVRCTSAQAKFPPAQVLVCARGIKVIGNYFSQCTVPGAPQIRAYIAVNGTSTTGAITFGSNGTIEIHNNTSTDAKTLWDTQVAGGTNATESANVAANTFGSNNVGTSSQTGVNQVVSAGAFTDDGTGYPGATALPATGGALDVAGANTSALWTVDYAGRAVTVPVNPGARQV